MGNTWRLLGSDNFWKLAHLYLCGVPIPASAGELQINNKILLENQNPLRLDAFFRLQELKKKATYTIRI
jgi:hypothetical protein